MRTFLVMAVLGPVIMATTIQAQSTAFTYQGRITDNGTNFSGAGQFEFALVTSTNVSTQATAVATNTTGFITGIGIINPGNGYTTAPTVTISGGGGFGATANATVSVGKVTGITVTDAGSGYASTPTVTIAPPPADIDYTTYWSNDGTSVNGSEPSNAVAIVVSDGLFTVTLGDTNVANMTEIPSAIFAAQQNLQLLIWFSENVNGFAELLPAQSLTPAPYAIFAEGASAAGLTGSLSLSQLPAIVITNNDTNVHLSGILSGTLSGTFSGNGNGLTYLDASELASGVVPTNVLPGFQPPNYITIAGGFGNTATAAGAFVGGGGYDGTNYEGNSAEAVGSTIGGGLENSVLSTGPYVFIGGGQANTAGGYAATVSGGLLNLVAGDESAIGGGYDNTASAYSATVAGGIGNIASGVYATVGGGANNTASGDTAMVPGGVYNTARGVCSFAAGNNAQAQNDGSFVWADASGTSFSSTADNQFAVRAAGGVLFEANVQVGIGGGDYHQLSTGGGNSTGFLYGSFPKFADGVHLGYNYYADASGNDVIANTGGATSRLTVGYGFIGLYVGAVDAAPTTQRLLANSSGVTVNGTFNNSSDRNVKQDFAPVSSSDLLDKVARLPISEWSYKEDVATRHVGPVAQDFYSIFNIGTDDKHIAPMDEGGVALAAIQGLNQKLESENAALRAENAALEQRLNRLEKIVLGQSKPRD